MRNRMRTAFLLWAALVTSRGLFAQDIPVGPLPVTTEELFARLRPLDLRYVPPDPDFLAPPPGVKALYVNAWAFGSNKLWHLVQLADETEINALVVDVKDDTGCMLYESAVATAKAIGANKCVRTRDIRARLDTLHAHDIHAIARIVVAKDPMLAQGKPEWSVKDVAGGLWRDRINSAWVDAHNDSVWIYAAQLAAEAISLGFQEVQFDYVRFPDEPRERMATAIFPARRPGDSQRESVRRHVRMMTERLERYNVPITFDIFGLTASAKPGADLGIGQVWEDFILTADVVLPMVYPSHYYKGAYGISVPNAQPYRVVRRALEEAIARSQVEGAAEIRPFLQAFTLGRRKPRYTPHEIREQIRAAEDVGINTWVLWNPRSVYQRDALRPYRVTTSNASATEAP